MELYQVCSNYAPGAKNGPAPGVTTLPGTQSAFNRYLYVSFKQNFEERFRATWPSCLNKWWGYCNRLCRSVMHFLLHHSTKSNQIWHVRCSYQWGVQWFNFWGGRAKRSIIIKFQLQINFKQMKGINYIRGDFHLVSWGGGWGWGTLFFNFLYIVMWHI